MDCFSCFSRTTFNAVLNHLRFTDLIQLMQINKRWQQKILGYFKNNRSITGSIVLFRNSIQNIHIEQSSLILCVKPTYHMKFGFEIELFYNKTDYNLFLHVDFFNRDHVFVELGSIVCGSDNESLMQQNITRFHLNHIGEYVYHFETGKSISFSFDPIFSIQHKVYATPQLNETEKWAWNNHFQVCDICQYQNPITMNDKFVKKLEKYRPFKEHCKRWSKKSNMFFYIDSMQGTDCIKIFAQYFANGDMVFTKTKLPERMETHRDCKLNETYSFGEGFFLHEHNCNSKSVVQFVNIQNSKIEIEKFNRGLSFWRGEILWIKKLGHFIVVDPLKSLAFVSKFEIKTVPQIENGQNLFFNYLFCQKSNCLLMWHHKGIIVTDISKLINHLVKRFFQCFQCFQCFQMPQTVFIVKIIIVI